MLTNLLLGMFERALVVGLFRLNWNGQDSSALHGMFCMALDEIQEMRERLSLNS